MTMIQLIACIGMIAGLFMVLGISPAEMSDSIFSRLTAAPGSIRADINETTKRKKGWLLPPGDYGSPGGAGRIRARGEVPYGVHGFSDSVCPGRLHRHSRRERFPCPRTGHRFHADSVLVCQADSRRIQKDVAAELETALSVITTAYLRTENFQQAVEENVRYLHHPVQNVFQRFLTRIKHIDPDMDAALHDLKYAIDNEVWQEWCEAVMACQTDRSLKSTLTPIVSKLSDMRVVNGELENLVFGPRKEFVTMAILVLINIPLVRFINTDWYHTLVDTIPGQMVIAVCIAAVFVSFAFVVKLTQPIEYRR